MRVFVCSALGVTLQAGVDERRVLRKQGLLLLDLVAGRAAARRARQPLDSREEATSRGRGSPRLFA